jgi:uncharacterized protein YneF (UPF0154 family)
MGLFFGHLLTLIIWLVSAIIVGFFYGTILAIKTIYNIIKKYEDKHGD